MVYDLQGPVAQLYRFLRVLTDISERMDEWAKFGKLKAFLKQDKIAEDIKQCHNWLTDYCFVFEVSPAEILRVVIEIYRRRSCSLM